MKTSEGKKQFTISLTELDIKILLEALGKMQNHQYDTGMSTKGTEYLTIKIYRAMGVRL